MTVFNLFFIFILNMPVPKRPCIDRVEFLSRKYGSASCSAVTEPQLEAPETRFSVSGICKSVREKLCNCDLPRFEVAACKMDDDRLQLSGSRS